MIVTLKSSVKIQQGVLWHVVKYEFRLITF